eukprot:TRINITY_DN1527_c0_g1_i2.p3 TRINITY_DN1527_c0_g1~~TRINITY_DN1527_c0_g1_i2.p3  ORF type:complete len:274 (-),score=101.21 TRINITY_DN1527_c0_g1_i2:147-968(-)
MAAAVSENLRAALDETTVRRTRLFSSFTTPKWLKPKYMTHVLAAANVITIVVIVAIHERTFSVFSFHPLFMSLGFLMCMSLGVIAYRNKFLLDLLSPIMMHGPTTKSRTMHITFQSFAGGFILLGLLFIVASKLKHGSTVVPHSIHAVLGSAVLVATAVQVTVGKLKYDSLTRRQERKQLWHGKMGLLLYDVAAVTILTGLWALVGVVTLSSLVMMLMLVLLWVNINYQMSEPRPPDVAPYSGLNTDDTALAAEESKKAEEDGRELGEDTRRL